MQDENAINEPNSVDEENTGEWQAPPPPEKIVEEEPPQMSGAATLTGIFFEPGKTFEDLRRKPRFVLAGLIIIIAATVFNALLVQKVGFERLVRARLEASAQIQQMPADKRDEIVRQQTSTVAKVITYAIVPVFVIIIFLIGGLLYWLGASAMGGAARFSHGVSVWVYASLPPTIVSVLANGIVLFLKSVDDIDIVNSQNGLVKANLSFLVDAKQSPALATLLGSFDLFAIWGWVLAAIGLQKVAKLSSGAAWGVVLIITLIVIAIKVILAKLFG